MLKDVKGIDSIEIINNFALEFEGISPPQRLSKDIKNINKMNKELKSREFDIPENILHRITQTVNGLGGQHVHGLNRAKKLLSGS